MVKLSIIIPYYKTYDLTIKLLDVLIPQLTEETELTIVDDGCHETGLNDFAFSDKFKKKWNYIHVWHELENKGACTAMNTGIDQTTGKYIAIIDSDDMITKDYIKTLINAIDTRTEDVLIMDWKDMHSGKIVNRPNNFAQWKAIYRRSIMPRCRDGWKYSYDVPFQEDLKKVKHTTGYLDKVLYIYNSNRIDSLTYQKKEIIEGRMEE